MTEHKRWGESGNVFFTLFGAVALVGVIGAATATLMRGPVGTMVNLNQKAKVDSQEQIAGKLAMLEAANQANNGDCDNDGYVEPIPPDLTCASHPTGGGCIPSQIGSAKNDPWGTMYGYCVWDHGASQCGTTGLLQGENGSDKPVIAIISAGPDRTFQTTCAADPTYVTTPSGSDDVVLTYTYAEAVQASGGLWVLKSGAPGTATIDKSIDVSGTASFQSGITGNTDFSGGNFNFAGASGFFLPNQTNSGACSGSDIGGLRTDNSSGTQLLQICDPAAPLGPHNHTGWVDVGGTDAGTGVAGSDGQVQYNAAGVFGASSNFTWNAGTGTLTATNAAVTTNETVGGALGVTGNATVGGTLGVTGNTTVGGTLGVTGKLTTATDTAIGGNIGVTGNGEIGGNTLLDGTLAVTGKSTLAGGALIPSGSAAGPGIAFTSASSTGLFYTSGGIGMSVAGADYATVSTSGLAVAGNIGASGYMVSTGEMAASNFAVGAIGSGNGLYSDGAGGLQLRTASTSRMVVNSTGEIGINVTGPITSLLDLGGIMRLRPVGTVAGSACPGIAGAITYASGDQLLVCSSVSGNWETIGTSGGGGGGAGNYWNKLSDNRLYYNANSVGVGTTSPLGEFQVVGGDVTVSGAYTGTAAPVLSGAGTRMFFDPASGAFRAETVGGNYMDAGNVGAYSTAFGYEAEASGGASYADGLNVQVTGNESFGFGQDLVVNGGGSIGFGLGAAGGVQPHVTGNSSFGIFSGGQANVTLSDSNTMALFGEKFLVDPEVPSLHLSTSGSLTGDIYGNFGAEQFCDQAGNNCFTAADIAGGVTGAPGNNREIIYNSGGVLGSNPGLIFASTGFLVTTKGIVIGGSGADTNSTFVNGGNSTSTGANNSYVGVNAGANNTTGTLNTATGSYSAYLNQTGAANTAYGFASLYNNAAGDHNTAIGYQALNNVLGDDNTGVGYDALFNVTSGLKNILVGENGNITTGSNNILLGNNLSNTTAAGSYQLDIGDLITGNLTTGLLYISSSAALQLPVGNTAQKPSGINGMIRYNTDNGKFEAFQAGAWQDILTGAATANAAGLSTQIQLNESGLLYASSGLTFNSTTGVLNVNRVLVGPAPNPLSPIAPVEIAAPVGYGPMLFLSDTSAGPGVGGGILFTTASDNDYAAYIGPQDDSHYGGALGFSTQPPYGGTAIPIQRMLITDAGLIGINTAAPAAQLDVAGEIRTTGGTLVCSNTTTGSIRYNSVSKAFDYCGGATPAWTAFTGAGATAAGADTQVQVNSQGVLYASTGLTFNSTTGQLTNAGPVRVTAGDIGILNNAGTASMFMQGAGDGTAYSQIYLTNNNFGKYWAIKHHQDVAEANAFELTYNDGATFTRGFYLDPNSYSAAFGRSAGQNLAATGLRNALYGASAGSQLTSGSYNTALGAYALAAQTTASNATAVGYNALTAALGAGNVALGYNAGATTTTGTNNILIGTGALANAATASNYLNIGDSIFGDMATGLIFISGTGALQLPVGTNAQKPTGANGMIRYNTNNGKFEAFQAGAWQDILTGAATQNAAGSATQIQFNSGGLLAANSGLVYTSAGYVGIGTASPNATLQINENAFPAVLVQGVSGVDSGHADLEIKSASGAGDWEVAVNGGDFNIYDQKNSKLSFAIQAAAPANAFYIQGTTGRVGVGTNSPSVMLDIRGTDAIQIPAGLTGSRPTGVAGMIRFNSTSNTFEGFNGSTWGNLASGGTMTAAGSNTQVQLNDGGLLYASSGFTFNSTTGVLTNANRIVAGGSGKDAQSVFVGGGNSTSTGVANTALGYTAFNQNSVGVNNTAIGFGALYNNTTGYDNMGLGYNTLSAVIGGHDNTAIGYSAGTTTTSGNNNILIGANAVANTATASNYLNIGNSIFGDMSTGLIFISGTGAVQLPGGASATRPAAPANGMIRYNTTSGKFEAFQGGSWQDILTGSAAAGGANTQIQFNSNGTFAGSAGLNWDATNGRLGIDVATPTAGAVQIGSGGLENFIGNQPHAAADGYMSGMFGSNLGYDGTNWKTYTDTGNNGGSMVGGDIFGNINFFTVPSTGASIQTITDANILNYDRMELTTAGSLGIGIAPLTKLDVAGTIRIAYSGEPCNATTLGAIYYNSTTGLFMACKTASGWTNIASGGTTLPAGSDQQVQFNNAGALGATSGLTFNSGTSTLTVSNNVASQVISLAPTATTTGVPTPMITATGAANTGITASTEAPDFTLNMARTETWATGALSIERGLKIAAPTYAFAGASTLTDAATVGITGAPVKGTNATITNAHGLLISSGTVGTAANSYGLTVNAQTGATNNYAAQFMGGNVGVKTASPLASLDVGGEIRTTGNTLLCSSTTTGAIRYNSSTKAFDYCGGATPAWTAFTGAGATAAGSDQQVQINSQGVLYASSGLTFNSSSGQLSVTASNSTYAVQGTNGTVLGGGVSGSSNGGIGVYGVAAGIGGQGVLGSSTSTTGYATGVSAGAVSTGQGVALYAQESGANNIGYAIQALNNSATGWGIYSSGTSPNYFAGKVGIGQVAPVTKFDVAGTIRMGYSGESCSSTTLGAMYYSSTTGLFYTCGTAGTWSQVSTGGSSTAAGSDQQVQVNNNGVLYASSGLTFNSTSGILTVAHGAVIGGGKAETTSVYISGGNAASTGDQNIAIGSLALTNNTTGVSNIAMGVYALGNNTTGLANIAIGYGAEYNASNGGNNVTVGHNSQQFASGSQNVSMGNSTLNVSSGGNNAAFGHQALGANTTGGGNTGIGSSALTLNTTGAFNTAVGAGSLSSATTGTNSALGYNAGAYISTGSTNTAIGNMAMQGITGTRLTGNGNTAVGDSALLIEQGAASYNTGLGNNALMATSTGSSNTATGSAAMASNTTGQQNTANGVTAMLLNTTGSYNVALGLGALYSTGAGSNNTAIGYDALDATTGNSNTALGLNALNTVTTGGSNLGLGSSVGTTTLTTGSSNILIGTSAAVDTPASGTSNFLNIGDAIFATGMTGTVASPAGSVGIGLAAPVTKLDIAGTIRMGYSGEACDSSHLGAIYYNSATGLFMGCQTAGSWTNIASGGTATPAGSDQQVQINSQGVLYASSGLTYNSTSGVLSIGRRIVVGANVKEPNSVYITGGNAASTGDGNVAMGVNALAANTTGNESVGIGLNAAAGNTTGQYNVAIGSYALYSNSVGGNNIAIGKNAQISATGYNNTAIGQSDLSSATGNNNTAMGQGTLYSISSGSGNSGFGQGALPSMTTGSANIALGSGVGASLTTGTNNLFLGSGAPTLTTGSNNILLGSSSAVDTPASGTSNFLNIGNTIFATGTNAGSLGTPAGAVGIDTDSPTAPLDVVAPSGTTTAAAFRANAGGTGSGNLAQIFLDDTYGAGNIKSQIVLAGSGVAKWTIGDDINGNGAQNFTIFDSVASAVRFYIDNSGNVGIGATAPKATLDVAGEIRTSGNTLNCSATTTGAIRYNSSSKAFDYCGGATPAWTAFSGGAVTPAGSDQQIQLNNSGVLYASTGLTFNYSTGVLTSANRAVIGGSGKETTSTFISGGNGTATGAANLIIGSSTGTSLSTGANNVLLGAGTLSTLSTQNHVIAIGVGNYYGNTMGNSEIAIGYNALSNNTGAAGDYNVAVGDSAGGTTSAAASTENVFIGNFATGGNSYNVVVGAEAQRTGGGGGGNIVLGYQAGYDATSTNSVLIGKNSYFSNGTLSTGTDNTIIGANTASAGGQKTGTQDVSLGSNTLNNMTTASNNVALGYNAGNTISTGTYNIVIGSGALTPAATSNYALNIGSLLTGTLPGGTGAARVGVNLSSAVTALDVNGTIRMSYSGEACDASHLGAIYYNSTTNLFMGCKTAGGWTNIASGGTAAPAGSDRQVQFNSAGAMAGASALVYTSAGQFGIGTTTPVGLLNVNNVNSSVDPITISRASNSYPATFAIQQAGSLTPTNRDWTMGTLDSSSNFSISTYDYTNNVVSDLTILQTGNIGVATSAPVAQLDVAGEIRTTGNTLNCSSTTTGSIRYNSSSLAFDYCGGSTPAWTAFGGIVSVTGASAPVSGFALGDLTNVILTSPASSQCLTYNGTNWVNGSCGAGGAAALSSLTAATATNSISNAGYAQTWSWNSLSTGTALTINSNSMTTGSLLSLSNSNTASAVGNVLSITNSETGGNAINASVSSGAANGIYSSTSSTTSYTTAVDGVASGTSGITYGVEGSAASGTGFGVYGSNSASGGTGVEGIVSSGTGTGVYGGTSSTTSYTAGVLGSATGTSGVGYGVEGSSASATGFGVYGSNSASNGIGIEGVSNGGNGIGVEGTTSSTTLNAMGMYAAATGGAGQTYGLYSTNNSTTTSASAAAGIATGTSGQTYGLYGSNVSTTNAAAAIAGYENGTSGQTYGLYGADASTATGAAGVYGLGTASTGTTYGVFGTNASAAGYGGYFTNSNGGIALYANGTLQIGNSGGSCTSTTLGSMYYNSGAFYGCFTAGSWTQFAPITGGAAAFSSLTAATGTNTINNAGNAQTWNWNSITSGTALSIASSSMTTGVMLNLSNTNTASNAGTVLYTTNAEPGGNTIYAAETATSGGGNGIYASTASTGSADGITGAATATSGIAIGVVGQSSSAAGIGVNGTNSASGGIGIVGSANSGAAIGVNGTTSSTTAAAAGVKGVASGTSGATYGVYGSTASTTTGAVGVYGVASGTSGGVNGVYGSSASASGIGGNFSNFATGGIALWGEADTGAAIGSVGTTSSTTAGATGLKGIASGASGATYGVYGTDASATGYGGYFTNTSTGTALYVAGNIQYTGTLTDTSDRRLKNDIRPLDERGSMLDKFGLLNTYSYNMKSDPAHNTQFGVMAQEMKTVFPELVRTDSTPNHYMSVNYIGLIAPLIQADKELKKQNDDLKAQLAQVKAQQAQMQTAMNDMQKDIKGLKGYTGYGVDKAEIGIGAMILFMLMAGMGGMFVIVLRRGPATKSDSK